MVKNTEDGTMIVEQILPFFTPEWTTTVRMVDEPEIILDIPLYLTNVALEDTYEGDFNERKAIIWTLDFTMKGFFFGPTKKTGVIKLANVNFYDSTLYDDIADAKGNASVTSRITIYPGLTANGEPTTDSSNTVPYSEISSTDNWDYIIELSGPILEE
jgi:hypothetical protein